MTDVLSSVKQLVNDRVNGSSKILADVIRLLLQESYDETELSQIFELLKSIDPAMNVVHHFRKELEPAIGPGFKAAVRKYNNRWSGIELKVATNLIPHLPQKQAKILTHSNSGLVISVLNILTKKGWQFHILQTKSNPGGEGELQAAALTKAGLKVTLIDDSAITKHLNSINGCLLGVDQYDETGFVNKTGSATIVKSAGKAAVPVYVVGDTRKRVSEVRKDVFGSLFEYIPFQQHVKLITETSER